MAGYNTLSEVLYLRKKALVVPRGGPSAEQSTRAGLLAQRGLIDVFNPADVSPEKMAERLVQDLERMDYPHPQGAIAMDGATQAVNRLLEVLTKGSYAASA
jgi:predicted glycosyltransferase